MGRGSEQTFFQRRHGKKVLRITNHQENTNQSHRELFTSHLVEWLLQTDKRSQVLVRMWRKGSRGHRWCGCKLVQRLWLDSVPPLVTTQIHLGGIMLSEISPRERQIPYDVTCMWYLNLNSRLQGMDWQWPGAGFGREVSQRGSQGTNFQLSNKWILGMSCPAWWL